MERLNPGALTLPEEMIDLRDWKAGEVVRLAEGKLPASYSIGKYIAETNYQNGRGSCTANATSHGLQALATKQTGQETLTILRKDLWQKMGHDLNNKEDSGDYVENALKTACNLIKAEGGGEYKLKGYSYEPLNLSEAGKEVIKRYLFSDTPLVRAIQGSSITWNEMSNGEVKSFVPVKNRTGGHCVLCVGYDEWGLWFLNSWSPNDETKKKSRFFISWEVLKNMGNMNNWRYRPIFYEAKTSLEYLKEKNDILLLLKALRKIYDTTAYKAVRKGIEGFSIVVRGTFPELNDEFPLSN